MPNAYWGGFIATNHWPVCSCHSRLPLIVKHWWQQLVRGWHHQIPQQNHPPPKKKPEGPNNEDKLWICTLIPRRLLPPIRPKDPLLLIPMRTKQSRARTHTHTHLSTNPTKARVRFSWLANQKQKYYHRDSITEAITAAASLDSTTQQQQQLKWSDAKSMGKPKTLATQRAAE
jgi:hypothetical protein